MNEENDSKKQIEQFKLRIKNKGLIHQSLLMYLGISADEIDQKTKKEEKSEDIYQILKENNILTNKCEFREFLETISYLCGNHQSKKEIKYKIESLLIILVEPMKNLFSEKEILKAFRVCKNYSNILILVEQSVLSIETISKDANYKDYYDWTFIKYFYPEIRKYDWKYFNGLVSKNYEFKQFVQEHDRNPELFYKIRKEGKEEAKIIELIREDRIEEFISYVELSAIGLNEKIQKNDSFFEEDTIELTPIEYSALFGSIGIFKYLYMKEAQIDVIPDNYCNNIIKYAFQGRNYEIIHLLEERIEIIEELNNNEKQLKYIEFLINIHHNEIIEYFMINYNIQVTLEIINLIIFYRNYQLFNQFIERNQIDFQSKEIISNIFYYFCEYENEEIVKILINQPNIDINSKDNIFDY